MNKPQSLIEEPEAIAGIHSIGILPFIGLGLALTAIILIVRHAKDGIDATIGKQKNGETVRKALAETGVEEGFCNVCEGKTFKKTPIEGLPLKPFVDTKNQVLRALGYDPGNVKLTCEAFPRRREGTISFHDRSRFNPKRVPFCNQTRR